MNAKHSTVSGDLIGIKTCPIPSVCVCICTRVCACVYGGGSFPLSFPLPGLEKDHKTCWFHSATCFHVAAACVCECTCVCVCKVLMTQSHQTFSSSGGFRSASRPPTPGKFLTVYDVSKEKQKLVFQYSFGLNSFFSPSYEGLFVLFQLPGFSCLASKPTILLLEP